MEQFKPFVGQIGAVEAGELVGGAKREVRGGVAEGVWLVGEDGVTRNEKGQRAVSEEDLEDPLVQEWLARNSGENLAKNKVEVTNEMREFKRMLNEFEATYSLEKLFAIVDLSADPDRKHPLRDPAKKALNPINEFRKSYIPDGDNELNIQWKKISNAVGMINKGMVDYNR